MTKTVLVVDDDKILRETLGTGLRKADFDVISAESAEQAKEILSRIIVDAIVLDRMMSCTDGLSFLKTLRRHGNQTPVIMLTAMGGAENAIDGLSSGANDYMAKPFQLKELVLRLNNIIKNNPIKNQKQITGLIYTEEGFFVQDSDGKQKLLSLSKEECKLLSNLITPIGCIVSATPMVAKRLRNKIKGVLSDTDIITVRGMGYRMITIKK